MGNDEIKVRMLGEFSLSCCGVMAGGQGNRSHKVKNLLAYLLHHHGRMIPVEELVGILGGEQKNAAPVAAFRTMLHRVRRIVEPIQDMIEEPLIITQNGMCGWNPQIAVKLDTEQFEMMCRSDAPEGPEGAEYYRQALELYQGDFLRELAAEQWVEPLAEHYRSLYMKEVETAAPMLIESGFASFAESYCCEALRQAPYHEALYRWLMRSRAAQGDKNGVAAAYEALRAQLYEDLGVIPEEETQRVYWSIVQDEGNSFTLDGIRAQLHEGNPAAGVFICDYGLFKLFYQAEARTAARRGDAIHIGVLTMFAQEENVLSTRELDRAMKQLRVQIQKNLRSGDIAARCSPSQYILMLVQANYEDSKRVCGRVVQAFIRTHPHSPVRLKTVVFPLEPAFGERDHTETGI